MSLKVLDISFMNRDEFLINTKEDILKERRPKRKELFFDSIQTFKKFMNQNKLQILMAISRLKPTSIYQLEKIINRKYPHVLKDCKQLAALGFINLIESNKAKKQLHPKLTFDYDFIRVRSEIEEIFPISERSNKILLEKIVA